MVVPLNFYMATYHLYYNRNNFKNMKNQRKSLSYNVSFIMIGKHMFITQFFSLSIHELLK